MNLDEYQAKIHSNWALAQKYEDRRLKLIKKLKQFPLYTRIFLYTKFNYIRKKIKLYEEGRSSLVLLTLGMTKHYIRLKKKYGQN